LFSGSSPGLQERWDDIRKLLDCRSWLSRAKAVTHVIADGLQRKMGIDQALHPTVS
jgi:hypothetical protein